MVTSHPVLIYSQFALQNADGSQYNRSENRLVTMEVTHDGPESKTVTEDVVVPDDAVVKYDVTPQMTDHRIRIQVKIGI